MGRARGRFFEGGVSEKTWTEKGGVMQNMTDSTEIPPYIYYILAFLLLVLTRIRLRSYYSPQRGLGSILLTRADEDSAPFLLLVPTRIRLRSSYSRRRGFSSILITRADQDSAPFLLLVPTRIQFRSYYSCRPGFGSILVTRADQDSAPFL